MNKGITAPNRELIGHRVTGSRLQEVFLLVGEGQEDESRALVIEPGGEVIEQVSVFDVAGEAMCGQIDLMPGWAVGPSDEPTCLAEDEELWVLTIEGTLPTVVRVGDGDKRWPN